MNILLTGANGYIGRRLLPRLVHAGHHVTCLVRNRARIQLEDDLLPQVTLWEGDLLKPETLAGLPTNLEVAFYLVHSMGSSYKNFHELEQQTANNFLQAIEGTQVKQVIYLSGIVNDEHLSKHLGSRLAVEGVLRSSQVPLTVLRAGIIIGSGGASFEIIRDIVEKLPAMVAPRWLNTRSQPIAVRNVLEYLEGVMLRPDAFGRVFDIGGPDVLTYRQMLMGYARVRGLRRTIITLPVLTPRLSSYWLYLVTSTNFSLARSLVDSMNNEVKVQHRGIEALVPTHLYSYEEAVAMAFQKIAQNEVVSSWKDALTTSRSTSLTPYMRLPRYGCFHDRKQVALQRDAEEVRRNIWSIGGQRGWYYGNWLWKIRGYMDKLVGGIGLRRGRRSPTDLVSGDALDFWRVLVADERGRRLLLYAEMKLPGDAWLEFEIKEGAQGPMLHQTATFRPNGVLGRLYWYSVLPFHLFIFKNMAQRIASWKPAY